MNDWKKAMVLALGLPSTILGTFFLLNELVKKELISDISSTVILISVILVVLIKMAQIKGGK